MAIVKICGLSEPGTLEVALQTGADMVGFVFCARSPRNISLDTARALSAQVRGPARKVALTVDAEEADLAAIVEALRPDILQFHGAEEPAQVALVRERFGLPVMKAIAIAESADLEKIAAYDTVADYLLFDARPPSGTDRPGGNGAAFDWSLLRDVDATKPWLLAGGLHDGNVAAALQATAAAGVDVSSGVESRPGVKDAERIARFVANARLAASRRATAAPTSGDRRRACL